MTEDGVLEAVAGEGFLTVLLAESALDANAVVENVGDIGFHKAADELAHGHLQLENYLARLLIAVQM